MVTGNSPESTAQSSAEVSTTTASSGSQSTVATTPQQSAPSGSSAVQSLNASTPDVVQTPFTPNFKFKVKDTEHEIDKSFHSFVTDAEKEKSLKDLYTKAYGLDMVKENLNKQKSEYDNYKQGVEPTLKTFNFLNSIVQNKDWDTFFGKLGVPEQEIFDWVSKRLDLHKAPPEQQAEHQRQSMIREQHYMQTQQLQEMQSQYQNQAVQHRTMQLDSLLSRPDISQYASAWDQRQGNVGSFRQLIIDEASAQFYQTGRDISTDEAINHVLAKFGKIVPVGQNQQQQAFGAPQAPGQVPVIPSVTGKGTSPVKKVPKSLDDLKELAKQYA